MRLDFPPELEHVTTISIQVEKPLEIGMLATGQRRVIPIIGGSFEGPRLVGEVLPGGADWQLIRPDNCAEIMARYTLRSRDGGLIEVENSGVRHAPAAVMKRLADGEPVPHEHYYFRTVPRFQTADPSLAWLNRDLFIGRGVREPDRVLIQVYRVC